MADLFTLTGPNGSSLNVASITLADPGPDFGESDLLKAAYSENPAAEGAVLAFETVNHRTMTFPVRVASSSAFGGALGLQSWLRTLARPGATLDIQLDGVPTAEAVRFDVLAGRFEVGGWNTFQYAQTDRFEGTLKLDTQPYGYWPTMILLASSASVGGPGVLNLTLGASGVAGSIIGDVPGLAEIFIAPTSATSYGNTQKTDSAYWSMGARPSFQAHWLAASALPSVFVLFGTPTLANPTLIGDKFAPASQALYVTVWTPSKAAGLFTNQVLNSWSEITEWVIPPALESAYRGRFRAYSWVRWDVPTIVPALPFTMAVDVQSGTAFSAALASAGPVASLPQSAASAAAGAAGAQGASPAYSLLDLGEITLPQVASQAFETRIRLWANPATSNLGYATTASAGLFVGGLYLQPLDMAGVLPRGLQQPTWASPQFTGPLYLSAVSNDVTVESATAGVASRQPYMNALGNYRGVFPKVGASTIQLDINLSGKQAQAGAPTSQPPVRSEPHFALVSVRYRPRFMFVKGI